MISKTREHIIKLPNDHLRERSKKVGLIDDKIRQLITDMESATLDWEDSRSHEVGIALAAIQIDTPIRIVIIRKSFDDKNDRSFSAFINPKITKFEGEIKEDFEGCLSIQDVYGKVPRYQKVRVVAQDLNGKTIRLTAEDFLARVFQHEIDHTNGKLFIDHIKNQPDSFYKLDEKGELMKLDYGNEIENSSILWK